LFLPLFLVPGTVLQLAQLFPQQQFDNKTARVMLTLFELATVAVDPSEY